MSRFVFVLLSLCVVGSLSQKCTLLPLANGTISGLSFCSMMNGRPVDSFFASSWVNPVDGKTWPQFIDPLLAYAYDQIVAYVKSVGDQNGFEVCDSCMENYKYLICGGAFPAAGYYDCLFNAIMDLYRKACPEICICNDNYCCFSGPSNDIACTSPSNKNPRYGNGQVSSTCLDNLKTGFFGAVFDSCAANYLPERAACQKLVATCACIDADSPIAAEACSMYSVNGIPFPMPEGSCSSSLGWCSNRGGKRAAALSINGNLKLNAPTPAAISAYSGANGVFGPSNTGPNLGVVPSSDFSTSDANSNVISLVVLSVALMMLSVL